MQETRLNPLNSLVRFAFVCTAMWTSLISTAVAYTLSGTVYGGSTPMAGATLTLINVDTAADAGLATSDSSGRFSFSVAAGNYNLLVSPLDKTHYADSQVNDIKVTTANVAQDVLLLAVVGTLSGTVRYPDGRPASEITVTIRTAVNVTGTDVTTDANGGYAIGLAAGKYTIGLSDCTANYLSGGCWWDTAFAANIDMTASVTKDLTLPFVKISGKTIDPNGTAVGGVDIVAGYLALTSAAGGGAGLTSGTAAKSDASGNYTLGLPAATGYQLVLTPPASHGGTYILSSLAFRTDLVKDLVLLSDKVLSGIVSYPDGRPASGVAVSVRAAGSSTATEVTTDLDGRYSLGLNAGKYSLGLTDCTIGFLSGGCWWDTAFVVNIDMAGSITKDITLPYVKVTGKTKTPTGASVGSVEIIAGELPLTSVGGGTAGLTSGTKTLSDSAGNFWLGIPAASAYQIVLNAPPSAGGSFILTNQNYSVDTVRDFVLQADKTLSGTVRYPDGRTASGVKISIRPIGSATDAEITTDANGHYSIGLGSGQYTLGVSDCTATYLDGACWWDTTFATGVDVSSNLTKDLGLPFVTLSGKTTDPNGVPVGGVEIDVAYITLTSAGTGSAGLTSGTKVVSDTLGNYSLGLPLSSGYQLTISPPAGSGFKAQTLNKFAATSTHQLEIILPFDDRAPPNIVSGPAFRTLTASSAVVEWQTDEPSRGWVKVGGATVLTGTLATTHSVQISGLSASTAYSAEVSVTDAVNNGPTVKSSSFTTAAVADTIAPVILQGPTVTGSASNSLVVEWVTSEPAKGSLSYGAGSALSASVAESDLSVAHRIEITGLAADTSHNVRVTATDAAGNGPTLSRTRSGRTLPAPDTTAPVIVNGPLVSSITENAATVAWKTDEPSTGGVSWNDGVAYGVLSDDKLDTDHSARITGLLAGKIYHLTVSSKDALGNGPTLSKTVDFATQELADTTPTAILSGPTVMNVTNQSAVIQWSTDEPSDSQIVYGTSAASLDKRENLAALTKTHSLPLVGLSPSTTYTLQVRSKDAAGNVSVYSKASDFTTAADPDTALPVFDSPPQVGYASTDRAVVQWKTNKLTDAQIQVTQNGLPVQIKNVGTQTDTHEVALTGLKPSQSYSVTVVSTDLQGNTSSQSLGTFTTPPAPDGAAPQISEVPTVVSVTDTQAVVRWVTDELANSRVAYGKSGGALTQITGDIGYRKEHIVVLTKLQANTAYQFQVSSTDPSGNGPTQSSVVSFTSGAQADVTAPKLSVAPSVTNLTPTSATVNWTTDELSTSVVNYGATGLTQKAEDLALTTSHSVILDNLTPSTHYQFAVTSTDGSGNPSSSAGGSFDTPAPAAVTLSSIAISGEDGITTGSTATYAVIGTFSDGKTSTVSAAWTFSGTAASFDSVQGVLSGKTVFSAETVTLSASYQGLSAQKTVTIRPATTGQPQPVSETVTYAPGWTLSGNGLATPMDVAATFGALGVAENVTTVWAWDANSTAWRFYSPKLNSTDLAAYVQSKGYQLLTSIAPREGFWVNAAKTFTLPARSALAVSVGAADLVTGWNLVSTGTDITPPDFNRSLVDTPPAAGTVAKNFTSLWAWDNLVSNWYFYAPSLEAAGPTKVKEYTDLKGYLDFAAQGKKLGLGAGFWVNRP